MDFNTFLKELKKVGLSKEDFSKITELNIDTLKNSANEREWRNRFFWIEN